MWLNKTFTLTIGAWFVFDQARGNHEMDAACPTCMPIEAVMRVQEHSHVLDDLPASRR